ncbi:MAG: ABC transporter ATP-binding protein [Candidatus Pacearchaeota archaeon]|nr:ABC transporter ATP-binding protein [Candidatus Pacearchaeota archaeon]
MKEKPLIVLKDVAKYYSMGDEIVKAVDGLNIEIKQGDFIAIIGPSGSGKSTTMNLVGSLDLATRGAIYLHNINIEELHESDLAQIRGKTIGFVFQSFNLIPNLTAKENIMLPMIFQGIEKEIREARADELLELVGLTERAEHHPNQLSGGEQQRIAIARALSNDPEIILADEPTGNLDTKNGEIILNYLERLNKNGKTIILVTHDSNIAHKHARIIYHIKDGKLEKITKKIKDRWVIVPFKTNF